MGHAVAIAKTQCRPRIHFLPIDMLNLQPLGMAFLDVVQFPGKLLLSTNKSQRKIPIKETKGKDGIHSYSVTYDKIEDVAAFCQFEHHMSSQSAKGALRFIQDWPRLQQGHDVRRDAARVPLLAQ